MANRQKQNIFTDNMNPLIILNLNQISACSVINLWVETLSQQRAAPIMDQGYPALCKYKITLS